MGKQPRENNGTLVKIQLVSAIIAVVFAIIVSIISSVTSGAWWAGELTTEIKHLNRQLEKIIEEGYTRREANAEFKHIKELIKLERDQRQIIDAKVKEIDARTQKTVKESR